MAVASSPRHSFLAGGKPLLPRVHRRPTQPNPPQLLSCCCRRSSFEKNTDPSGEGEMPLAKLAVVALAAGVLALGSAHEAAAAKSGGRVGGQAFRSAAPKQSAPRTNNSRTNIYINPPVAPPLIGGYGYGAPYYGGWGWSPFTFFAPGPGVAVGGGFDLFVALFVLSAVAAVIRRFTGPRDDDEDEF